MGLFYLATNRFYPFTKDLPDNVYSTSFVPNT